MRKRSLEAVVSVLMMAAVLHGAPDTKKIDAEVRSITKSAILIDTHNDIPSFTVDGTDIGKAPKNHTDIPRLRQGGVGAVFFSVYVAATYVEGNHSANRALQMIDTVQRDIIDRYPNDFMRALTADDIEKARRKHKIAALMGLEGGHAIEDSTRLLRDYYRLGIRYMTLTHWNTNSWADSSGDITDPKIEHHNGLTPLAACGVSRSETCDVCSVLDVNMKWQWAEGESGYDRSSCGRRRTRCPYRRVTRFTRS